MKIISMAFALLLLIPGVGQTLSQKEREQGVAEVEGSRKTFLDASKRTFRGAVELQARAGPLVDSRMRRAHRRDGNIHPELNYRAGAERTGGAGEARVGSGERQLADDYGG